MKLSNPFAQYVRDLWFPEHYWCGDCGHSDRPIELHHIYGRESNSAYNSIPLCKKCHDAISFDGESKKEQYVMYASDWLNDHNYEPRTNDEYFLNRTARGNPAAQEVVQDHARQRESHLS